MVKKDHCENRDGRYGYRCTSHIPYPGVLELDHIDGDRCNNVIANVQTLCKVCHSYKGHLNGDFKKNKNSARNKRVLSPSGCLPDASTSSYNDASGFILALRKKRC